MNDAELIARADANYFTAMSAFVASTDRGEVRADQGIILASSGTAVAAFNITFVTRPLDDPARRMRDAVAFFDERREPFIVRVRDGVDPQSERAAREAGLRYADTVPGMVLYPAAVSAIRVSSLRIRTVADQESLEHHRCVIAEAFEMPMDLARYFLTERVFKIPDTSAYVGYIDDRAVATSALFMTHRVAGVYNVATVRDYRKRGLGEAMTWHAVRTGIEAGCLMASLQASEMGEPVYRRMGFRTLAPYRTFGRPDH